MMHPWHGATSLFYATVDIARYEPRHVSQRASGMHSVVQAEFTYKTGSVRTMYSIDLIN